MVEPQRTTDTGPPPSGTGIERRGGKVFVWVDGKAWELAPLDLQRDFAAAEQRYAESLLPPVAAVAAEMKALAAFPELRKEMLDRAYRDIREAAKVRKKPPAADVQRWLDSEDGIVWTLWRQLLKAHPQVTEEDARTILWRVGVEAAQGARDESNREALQAATAGASAAKKPSTPPTPASVAKLATLNAEQMTRLQSMTSQDERRAYLASLTQSNSPTNPTGVAAGKAIEMPLADPPRSATPPEMT